jgi:hypothetical protein
MGAQRPTPVPHEQVLADRKNIPDASSEFNGPFALLASDRRSININRSVAGWLDVLAGELLAFPSERWAVGSFARPTADSSKIASQE